MGLFKKKSKDKFTNIGIYEKEKEEVLYKGISSARVIYMSNLEPANDFPTEELTNIIVELIVPDTSYSDLLSFLSACEYISTTIKRYDDYNHIVLASIGSLLNIKYLIKDIDYLNNTVFVMFINLLKDYVNKSYVMGAIHLNPIFEKFKLLEDNKKDFKSQKFELDSDRFFIVGADDFKYIRDNTNMIFNDLDLLRHVYIVIGDTEREFLGIVDLHTIVESFDSDDCYNSVGIPCELFNDYIISILGEDIEKYTQPMVLFNMDNNTTYDSILDEEI